jgi:hypothetical protein
VARIRYVKPELFTDEDLAELPYVTRWIFEGLWCHADRAGRLEYRPKYLRSQIIPYDNEINCEDFEKHLLKLAKPELINRPEKAFIKIYAANKNGNGLSDEKYIQILEWHHQRPHHTERESLIPSDNGYQKVKKRLRNDGDGDGDGDGEYQGFVEFWKVYPRRVSKALALKAWLKIAPGPELVQTILAAVEVHKKSEQWKKDNGQFIPHPSTWLNQKRWEDELEPAKQGDPGLSAPRAKEPGL